MLRFQFWKIFLVFGVLSLGVIYSMPNIFHPDPAVQITFNSSGGSFNDRVVEKIKSDAEKEKINFSSVEMMKNQFYLGPTIMMIKLN